MRKIKSIKQIGTIENFYGHLYVAIDKEGYHYWSIENYDGHRWEIIPKSLYEELIKFEDHIVSS